ncbi:MAG: hypothetical protein H7Z37_17835, partial [Pyrinomonadaceae bacterium]|nr:hypothetical protein [Pyrinomonadaceae bacterium]
GKVMNLAAKAGLPKVPRAYPSMALGTAETTPLMMASAYTTFANNGVRTAPTIIDLITTGDGRTVAAPLPQKTEVLRPDVNYVMVDMLKDVINRGTAADLRAWGFKNVANKTGFAGKTGTSRDGWFAGFTPELVCVVYVGFDDGSDLGMKGSDSAMPIWADFMKTALAAHPEWNGDWRMPEGIQKAEVDIQTGNVINNELDANGANLDPSQTTVIQTPDGESVLTNQNPASTLVTSTIPPEFRRIELFINGTVPQKSLYTETDETQTLDEQIVSPTPETTTTTTTTTSEMPDQPQPIKPNSTLEQKMLEQNPMRQTTAQPSNIILQVCPITNIIAAPSCPTSRPKVFTFGTEPKQFCKPEYHRR